MGTITVLPQLVTSGGAGTNEVLTINTDVFRDISYPTMTIEVITGTLKFAVGQTAANSSASYTAEKLPPITLRNKPTVIELNFIDDGSVATFKIGF